MHGYAIDPLLGPVVVLITWTQVMLAWLAVSRRAAMKEAGIDPTKRPGGRGQDLEGIIPDRANWKAHNYAHLMEQPTIFYAIVFCLILMGQSLPINKWLAWGYVILRIVHSIVQATINRVSIRFPLFALSTLGLLGLTIHALAWVIGSWL